MARTTMNWLDLSEYRLALAIGAAEGSAQPVVLGSKADLDQHRSKLEALGFLSRGNHMHLPNMSSIPSLDTWKADFPQVQVEPTPGYEIAKDKVSAKYMLQAGWVDREAFKRPEGQSPKADSRANEAPAQPTTYRWLDLSAYGLSISYRSVAADGELRSDGEKRMVVMGSKVAEDIYGHLFEQAGATLGMDRPTEGYARIVFENGFDQDTMATLHESLEQSVVAEVPQAEVVRDDAENPFADWEPIDQIDWPGFRHHAADLMLGFIDKDSVDHFVSGWWFANAAEYSGLPRPLVSPDAGISWRHMQETAEAATVEAFKRLPEAPIAEQVRLAGNLDRVLPGETAKSGKSQRLQQYSTPLVISVVLQDILGIDQTTSVWEPTAGNGSLVTRANPALVGGNEVDRERLTRLHDQGLTGVRHADALRVQVPDGEYDRLIANPPFGAFSDGNGPREFTSFVPFEAGGTQAPHMTLGNQDQMIALRHLQALKEDGLGALVLGADHPMRYPAGEISEQTENFLRMLYDTHDVIDVHYVDGSLYGSHGAAWPLILVVTGGRREAVVEAEPPASLPVIRNVDELLAYHGELKEHVVQWQREVEQQRGRDRDGNGPGGDGGDGGAPDNEAESTPSGANEEPATPEEPDEELEQEFEQHEQPPSDEDFEALDEELEDDAESESARHAAEDAEVPYEPRSSMKSLNKRMPANLVGPVSRALDTVQLYHGDIDLFVSEQLGWSMDELEERLAAEQVDAVALAMHQGELNRGFVLGDNTGIGKGRVLATLMAWGVKNGDKPIFVTSKAGLFADIMRDLRDIGEADIINPLVMNDIPEIRDRDGNVVLKNTQSKIVNPLIKERTIGKDFNAVMMTYSQVNKEIGKSPKAQWLTAVAEDNVLLLDEVHNAAGPDSNTGANMVEAIRGAKFVMGSSGTYAKRPDNLGLYVFTSMFDGTDPETLISTVATGGTEYQEVLSTMLAESGQMIVRSHKAAPAPAPKLLHPEYDGLDAREIADRMAVVLDALTGISEGASEIVNEENEAIKEALQAMPEGMRKNFAHWKSQTLNFGSIMHHVVRQAMFALKTQGVVEEVKRSIGEGRRVVVGIDNTMETFLKDVMASLAEKDRAANEQQALDSQGVGEEDLFNDGSQKDVPANISYRDTIHRLMVRLINIDRTDRYGNTQTEPAFDIEQKRADLESGALDQRLAEGQPLDGDQMASMYFEAEELVNRLPQDLPASPIDYIRSQLEKDGVVTGEITGREIAIDYSDEDRGPVFTSRDKQDRDRIRTAERFNHEDVQVVFLNSSGAEGVSLHGHRDFVNNEDREMMFAQIPYDVATYNQLSGRIDRTGEREGYSPHYTLLGLDIPAEKRQMANLVRKDSSLKANTRADREGKVEMYGVPCMNRVGDQVTYEVLRDYPNRDRVCAKLGINIDSEGEKFSAVSLANGVGNDTGLYSKVMSRLSRMQLAEAEPIVEAIEDLYLQRIEVLDQSGSNPMKTKILDLQAEIQEDAYEVVPKSGPSSFQAAVIGRPIVYKESIRPIELETVEHSLDRMKQRLGKVGFSEMPLADKWKDIEFKQMNEMRRHASSRAKAAYQRFEQEETNPEQAFTEAVLKRPASISTDQGVIDSLRSVAQRHNLMRHLRDTLGLGIKVSQVPMFALGLEAEAEKADFVVTGFKVPKPTENPAAPSNWSVIMMSPDGSVGAVKLSLSQFMNLLQENPGIRMSSDPVGPASLGDMFNADRPSYTESRTQIVLMGNLFAAVQAAETARENHDNLGKPLPAVFTDDQGVKHRGILMPRDFELGQIALLKDVDFSISKHDVAMAYIDHMLEDAQGSDREVELYSSNAWYTVSGARANQKPDALGTGVRLVRDQSTSAWKLEISKKRKDNKAYLKDGVLGEMLAGEFETMEGYENRNKMSATLRSNALLPEVIQRLMVHHRIAFHGSREDSEWHRDHLRERGQRLEEHENDLHAQLGGSSEAAVPANPPSTAEAEKTIDDAIAGFDSAPRRPLASPSA